MHLLAWSSLLLLISTSYGENTVLSSGLVANPLSTSAIIDIPSCKYSGMNATLHVNSPTNKTFIQLPLTVPQCRPKRDLIVIGDPQNGNVDTVNVGFQVLGLEPDTQYTAWYEIAGTNLNATTFTTTLASLVPPVVFRRSGGMVVITVLLSIAMIMLVVGLIVALALGGRGTK